MAIDERRLGDRILHALELAVAQEKLEVAEPLAHALEACLTSFGGPGKIDRRELPEAMLAVFDDLDRLRRSRRGD